MSKFLDDLIESIIEKYRQKPGGLDEALMLNGSILAIETKNRWNNAT